jgi:hypothetical protein
MPRLPVRPLWPQLDLRARPRLPLLDEFDVLARPTAIEYAPFQLTSPMNLVTHASVVVEPNLRRESQPIRVLHNGRFSLPAGTYRIEVEWNGARAGEVMGLQIGRTGDPMLQWTVDARPGERWTTEFSIPVDAGFVGLRGSAELERIIKQVRFVPVAIVDAGRRPRGAGIIGASQSGPAFLFYYDTNASPEREGFWVWGARQTRVTIQRPAAEGPLVLRVHSGPIANRLHVSTFGWSHTVALQPAARQQIEVPIGTNGLVTLDLTTDAAFVPRSINPASTDTRSLGVWVEVAQ